MAFDCLVLCDELESLKVLCKALDEAEINRDICTDLDEATQLLNGRKYEAVIVDCAGIEQGSKFLRMIRRAPSNKQASVFALVAAESTAPDSFQKGANFALLKPLSLDALSRSLRAAHSLMLQERRRWFRHPVELVVELKRHRAATVHCVSRNVSEGGMGLRSANGIAVGQEFEIHFRIPGDQNWTEGKCEVRWLDQTGNAGVRFLHLPQADHKRLKDWLQEQFEKTPPSLLINAVKKLRRP
jgi:CheY-like chemotaxis protein